jgi:hypothetical protein
LIETKIAPVQQPELGQFLKELPEGTHRVLCAACNANAAVLVSRDLVRATGVRCLKDGSITCVSTACLALAQPEQPQPQKPTPPSGIKRLLSRVTKKLTAGE